MLKQSKKKAVADEDYEAALKYKNQIADLEKKVGSADEAKKVANA
jgi:ATP-dependent Clp protease ATP-binding subunit ClpL